MTMKARDTRPRNQIVDEHIRLQDILNSVRLTLAEKNASPTIIAEMLDEMTQCVLDHFQHEEQSGFFEDMTNLAPRLVRRAETLCCQHPEMAAQLIQIQETARTTVSADEWWRQLNDQFACFLDFFQLHEAAEHALMQAVYNDDLGTED